jgi:hypothetical protein
MPVETGSCVYQSAVSGDGERVRGRAAATVWVFVISTGGHPLSSAWCTRGSAGTVRVCAWRVSAAQTWPQGIYSAKPFPTATRWLAVQTFSDEQALGRREGDLMGVPIRRAALCTGLVLTTGLAGCSSSGGSGSPETTTGSTGSSGGAPAATAKQITKVFKIFFDTKTSLAKSVTVLQHGPLFRSTLNKESGSPSAVDITAKVSDVSLVSKKLAKVTFTIYSGKTTLLPDSPGYAVREGGHWKVAAQTFCGLLTLEGTAPPACKKKSVTALPH